MNRKRNSGLRQDDNLNKFSAKELADYRQSQKDMDSIYDDMQAELDEKEKIVLVGLQKYGFSEAGTKEVMRLIKKSCNMMGESFVSSAEFDTQAKYDAAQRAYTFYWK